MTSLLSTTPARGSSRRGPRDDRTSGSSCQRRRPRPASADRNRSPHRGAKSTSPARPTKSRCSRCCASTISVKLLSRRTRCMHSEATPTIWCSSAGATTCSLSRETSPACSAQGSAVERRPARTHLYHPRSRQGVVALRQGRHGGERAPSHSNHPQDPSATANKPTTKVVYTVTSLTTEQTTACDLAKLDPRPLGHREPSALGT
jgi:hypothetical protein